MDNKTITQKCSKKATRKSRTKKRVKDKKNKIPQKIGLWIPRETYKHTNNEQATKQTTDTLYNAHTNKSALFATKPSFPNPSMQTNKPTNKQKIQQTNKQTKPSELLEAEGVVICVAQQLDGLGAKQTKRTKKQRNEETNEETKKRTKKQTKEGDKTGNIT